MASLTEKEFQEIVTGMCDDRNIIWHHCDAPFRCSGYNGFPDLVLLGRYVMFVELKSWYGKLRPEQNVYKQRLDYANAAYAVWKPRDLYNSIIETALDDLQP